LIPRRITAGNERRLRHLGKKVRVSKLDVDKMLAELRLEREQIEEAILTLERLARGRGRRRGRPPSWLREATAAAESFSSDTPVEVKRRGRPPATKGALAHAVEVS
jgi:CRISPR/Cas system-associated exonuclease Cas4 (RecB family)